MNPSLIHPHVARAYRADRRLASRRFRRSR
jgi:hypothetical protein